MPRFRQHPALPRSAPESVTIVFDGQCGVCTAVVARLIRLDRQQRLHFVPCQSVDAPVERSRCEREIWVLAPNGERWAGGDGALVIACTLVHSAWPVRVFGLPVLRHAVHWGYRLIARNRHRLPGIAPWCASHPDACQRNR